MPDGELKPSLRAAGGGGRRPALAVGVAGVAWSGCGSSGRRQVGRRKGPTGLNEAKEAEKGFKEAKKGLSKKNKAANETIEKAEKARKKLRRASKRARKKPRRASKKPKSTRPSGAGGR